MNRTETFAVPGIRMMKSAAQIRTESVAQRRLPSQDRSTCGQPDGLNQLLRIRHLQFHDFAGGERTRLQFAYPVPSVHAQNVIVGRRSWAHENLPRCDPFAKKHFLEEAEFL